MQDTQVARALGVTGMGIGLAELAAPGWISEQLGIDERDTLLRAMGAREILAGVGILAEQRPTAGLWARVAGDALDLALLGVAASKSTRKKNVIAAIGMVAAISGLDLLYALKLQRNGAAA